LTVAPPESRRWAVIVEVVQSAGLRPVALDELPEEIDEDDLGVVCWMAVLEQ